MLRGLYTPLYMKDLEYLRWKQCISVVLLLCLILHHFQKLAEKQLFIVIHMMRIN